MENYTTRVLEEKRVGVKMPGIEFVLNRKELAKLYFSVEESLIALVDGDAEHIGTHLIDEDDNEKPKDS